MTTDLQALMERLERLERERLAPIFNAAVAGGSGIMPSKLSATLNAGQTAALITGNTNLEQDIQDLRTFVGSMTPGAANKIIKSDGTNWLAGTVEENAGALSAITTIALSGVFTSTDTTDATSINTGSIITDGGVGIEKALWVGGLANIAGAVTMQSTLAFSATASQIIPGATSMSLRNNANSADNLHITDAGIVTLRNTLVTGGTISALTTVLPGASLTFRNTANTADNVAITDAGAVTVRSTLTVTSVITGSKLVLTAAGSRIVPGTSNIAFMNNAQDELNLQILDNGNTIIRGTIQWAGDTTTAVGTSYGRIPITTSAGVKYLQLFNA